MATDKGLEEIPECKPFGFPMAHCATLAMRTSLRIIGLMLISLFCVAQIESNYDEVTDSFDAMNLKSELLRGNSCTDPAIATMS